MSLGWVYLFMGILIGSAVIPITLSMTWGRVNSLGMMTGAISGNVLGLTVWLTVASTYEGGLSKFFDNTGLFYINSLMAFKFGPPVCK